MTLQEGLGTVGKISREGHTGMNSVIGLDIARESLSQGLVVTRFLSYIVIIAARVS
ncbi:hypothetical protein FHS14_001127 [Paenibacillus baekrokdamisoli]|nr:hypothetical protein [Paenibacillus baekrokdamisoli]